MTEIGFFLIGTAFGIGIGVFIVIELLRRKLVL